MGSKPASHKVVAAYGEIIAQTMNRFDAVRRYDLTVMVGISGSCGHVRIHVHELAFPDSMPQATRLAEWLMLQTKIKELLDPVVDEFQHIKRAGTRFPKSAYLVHVSADPGAVAGAVKCLTPTRDPDASPR